MAVFKTKCANTRIWINTHDHLPPHCHIQLKDGNAKVTFDGNVFDSGPITTLPPKVRKCIEKHRAEMIERWTEVRILPIRGG